MKTGEDIYSNIFLSWQALKLSIIRWCEFNLYAELLLDFLWNIHTVRLKNKVVHFSKQNQNKISEVLFDCDFVVFWLYYVFVVLNWNLDNDKLEIYKNILKNIIG